MQPALLEIDPTPAPQLVARRRELERLYEHLEMCCLEADRIGTQQEIDRLSVIVSAMEAARLA